MWLNVPSVRLITLTVKKRPLSSIKGINLCKSSALESSLCPFIEVAPMHLELVIILTPEHFLEGIRFFYAVGYKRILTKKLLNMHFLSNAIYRRINTTILTFKLILWPVD